MLQRSLTRPLASRGIRGEISRITRNAPRCALEGPRFAVRPAALFIRRDISTNAAKHGPCEVKEQSILGKLSLDGKVTVITGGARGIGLALAETVAGLGSNVAILDVLEPERPLTGLEKAYKTKFKYYRMDVTSKDDMDATFTNVVNDFGQIDRCITSAGIALDKPFLEHTWEECSRILDINVLGSFFSAQLAAKQMVKQGNGGAIVMIASIAAHCAIPAQRVSIYGASKAAIKLLGQTIAVEMAPFNIRVNTLSPGFIATSMSQQFTEIQNVFQTVPPIRRIGRPDDLTLAVAYLLSDGASYTTGADIAVTGGLHNGRIDI